jgi:hypothetical protein
VENTPLRALATYATVARFLSHKVEYIGDIQNKDGPNGRGRVFANKGACMRVCCANLYRLSVARIQPVHI